MLRSAFTAAATIALSIALPGAAQALPVNPLPDSVAPNARANIRDLLAETSDGCADDLDACETAQRLLIDERAEQIDAFDVDFEKARLALLRQKRYLFSESDDDEEILIAAADIVETPLPAAIFPMALGLAGAGLALRLRNGRLRNRRSAVRPDAA